MTSNTGGVTVHPTHFQGVLEFYRNRIVFPLLDDILLPWRKLTFCGFVSVHVVHSKRARFRVIRTAD